MSAFCAVYSLPSLFRVYKNYFCKSITAIPLWFWTVSWLQVQSQLGWFSSFEPFPEFRSNLVPQRFRGLLTRISVIKFGADLLEGERDADFTSSTQSLINLIRSPCHTANTSKYQVVCVFGLARTCVVQCKSYCFLDPHHVSDVFSLVIMN